MRLLRYYTQKVKNKMKIYGASSRVLLASIKRVSYWNTKEQWRIVIPKYRHAHL